MGHDAHFLSRLTRLGDQRTLDLALGLYRDPRAVQLILDFNPRVGDAERVALALGPPPRSGHIIVARDGGFVTCLGPGMTVSDRVVLTRAEVDRALEHSAAIGRADARINWQGGLDALLDKLSLGRRVAREDFDAVYTVAPALHDLLSGFVARAMKSHESVVRGVRLRTLDTNYDRTLHAILASYGNIGVGLDQTILLGLPSTLLTRELESTEPSDWMPAHTHAMISTAELTTAARVATVTAQVGEPAIEPFARRWREASHLQIALESFTALVALARHLPRMRRKILGILDDRPSGAAALAAAMPAVRRGLDDPEAVEARLRDRARRTLAEEGVTAPDDALVEAVVGARQASLFEGQVLREDLPAVAIWAARRSPLDYYVPAAMIDGLPPRILPRQVPVSGVRRRLLTMYDHYVDEVTRHEPTPVERILRDDGPVAAGPKVGRNSRCPCGSGRKYKRCCLRTR